MNIRRVFAVAAIPFVISVGFVTSAKSAVALPPSNQIALQPPRFGFISLNPAIAGASSHQMAQVPQPPNQAPDGQHKRPSIDFKAAANKLGVSEAKLKDALGVPANPPNPSDPNARPPRPDFKSAATKLGVSEAKLKDALGVPANPPNPSDPNARPPRPDFKAAAAKLGVTEQQLVDALGIPPHRPGEGPK